MRRMLLILGVVLCLAPEQAVTAATGPQCGDVLTASTVLTTNLLCSGDGLTFAPTADATLDLRGHLILGRVGAGTGLVVSPYLAKASVKGGTIRGFTTGVELAGFGSTRLAGLTVRNNGTGVRGGVNGGHFTTLANSTITNNQGDGVQVAFIRPFEMTNDRITENGGNGIFAFEDSLSLLRDSFIGRNGLDGADIFNSFSVISGNTFLANGGRGLAITDSLLCQVFPTPPYTVANNLATENQQGGMIASSFSPGCDPVPPAGGGNIAENNLVFQCILIVCNE